MMEAIAQLGVGFVIALSGVLLPGPLLAFIILKSSAEGAKTGPLVAAGHILVELGIISLIALGLVSVLESRTFQTIIGLVGGILLLTLGTLYLLQVRKAGEFQPSLTGLRYHPLIGGVLFSTVLNPAVPLWWATVGVVTLTDAFLVGALAGAVFWLVGHFLADLSWFSLVSYFVARGRRFMGMGWYKGLLIACGCLLLGFGAYFIARYALPLL
jgi:threonine/homoserine/homoserine lactone efflux protein